LSSIVYFTDIAVCVLVATLVDINKIIQISKDINHFQDMKHSQIEEIMILLTFCVFRYIKQLKRYKSG